MSAIRVDQNILNQRGTPAFFADDFSRRPAAGYQGRIFISADTHEIYRDDTTAWVLIADAGAGSGTLQSVTANGNTTSYGIDILGVGLRVQAGGITDYTIPSGGIMFGSPSYLLTTDTTNLFWDDTNNRLGLGTNTPGARLDIHATGTNATFNGTGTSNSTLVFQRSGTSRWTIGNYYSSAVADDFNIYDNVNAQYRFYVHNTGVINIPTSLIIGSSTPTSSYIFDVTGNSNVTGTFRTTGAITGLSTATFSSTVTATTYNSTQGAYSIAAAGSYNGFQFGADNTTAACYIYDTTNSQYRLVIKNGGNVGIGTITPQTNTHIVGTNGVVASYGQLFLQTSNTATIDMGGQISLGGFYNGTSNYTQFGTISARKENSILSQNGYLSFATNNNGTVTEAMRISSAGVITQTGTNISNRIVSSGNGEGWFGVYANSINTLFAGSAGAWEGNASNNGAIAATNSLTFYTSGTASVKMSLSTAGVLTVSNLATGALTSVSGVITSSSDKNLKIDDGTLDKALDKVLKLIPRYFYWKEETELDTKTRQLGFYAQEVNEALGEEAANTPKDNRGWGIYDRAIIAMLTKSIQELNEKLVRNNIN